MLNKNTTFLVLIFLFLFYGCGLKEGVIQKEPKSYLWFTGQTSNAVIYIDNLEPIILDDKTKKEVHYEVAPGRHTIIVKKFNKEVVNRNLLLGNGITREIKIP